MRPYYFLLLTVVIDELHLIRCYTVGNNNETNGAGHHYDRLTLDYRSIIEDTRTELKHLENDIERMKKEFDIKKMQKKVYRKIGSRLRTLEEPVWIISHNSDGWFKACEGPCSCRPQAYTISCWKMNLKTVPSEQIIPHDVKSLDMGLNEISTFHKDAFKGLFYLSKLDLSYNAIDFLPRLTFDNLRNLKILKIQKNKLTSMQSKIFAKLKGLKYLDLSRNMLDNLPQALFRKLNKLETLNLGRNKLQHLTRNLFYYQRSLQELDLSYNRLTAVHSFTFERLINLKKLNLNENQIQSVQYDDLSKEMVHLRVLSLQNNLISSFGPTMKNVSQLTHLYLSHNKLSQLNGSEFSQLTELRDLDLAGNKIRTLPNGIFNTLKNLEKLSLNSNNLSELPEGIFYNLQRLVSLLLNRNNLQQLDANLLINLKQLQTLNLSYNMLSKIPKDFFSNQKEINAASFSKNFWNCDCSMSYFSRWLHMHEQAVEDVNEVICKSPNRMLKRQLKNITFYDLCADHWASMAKLPPRWQIGFQSTKQPTIN